MSAQTPQLTPPRRSRGSLFREVRNAPPATPRKPSRILQLRWPMPGIRARNACIWSPIPLLTFSANGYSYRIERKATKVLYRHRTAKTAHAADRLGVRPGTAGQTYVLEKDGVYYESFVSYYKAPDALDITMGDQNSTPATLLEAAGGYGRSRETRLLQLPLHRFRCGGPASPLTTLVAGVPCERCHGETAKHRRRPHGDAAKFEMKKLGAMSTEETSDFCGQCHRTWDQIAVNGPHGVLNVRFQPYRLTNSRCYDVDDKRIACVGCHDPHKEIDRVSTDYDAKCQACHAGGKPGAKACPVEHGLIALPATCQRSTYPAPITNSRTTTSAWSKPTVRTPINQGVV